jgi:hypothetical protein
MKFGHNRYSWAAVISKYAMTDDEPDEGADLVRIHVGPLGGPVSNMFYGS